MLNRQFLIRFRSILIDLLNTVDDELGLPRTVPKKTTRREEQRKRRREQMVVDVSSESVI